MKIYVSGDAAARAMGADQVADAIVAQANQLGIHHNLVRTGSRGMVWLEPLVEIDRGDGQGRIAYGPVTPADVPQLLAGQMTAHGPVEAISFFARQTRVTFARCGLIDPLSFEDYQAHGGLEGLRRALQMDPSQRMAEMTASGLRGRGGAGFPTAVKWQTVAGAAGVQKYIVCNADEGDSGTFADRMLMEGDPFCLIEGMVIAGLCVGADRGYIYLRSEYPDAARILRAALQTAQAQGLLGASVLGSGRRFEIELRIGAGAYVCGEETALLNSLEGRRGTVRAKPPLPALSGLFGAPTVVNNVLTLAAVPAIFANGGAAYAAHGVGRSRGTVALQIAGNVARGGLFEAGFGLTLAEVVHEIAGGTATGLPIKAVQVGGPLGAYIPTQHLDTPLGYEEFDAIGGLIGHAGLVVFDSSTDMRAMARFAMEFCAVESCGKCTPCRIGSTRGVETIDRIASGEAEAVALLEDLCETMRDGSLCALGGFTPYPVLSALKHFPSDFLSSPAGQASSAPAPRNVP